MSNDCGRPEAQPGRSAGGELLRGQSPRVIATVIRGLDSRLAGIEYEAAADEPALTYTFEVAGMRRAFRLAVAPPPLESLVDLFPEAAACERQLSERFGLRFEPAPPSHVLPSEPPPR